MGRDLACDIQLQERKERQSFGAVSGARASHCGRRRPADISKTGSIEQCLRHYCAKQVTWFEYIPNSTVEMIIVDCRRRRIDSGSCNARLGAEKHSGREQSRRGCVY
jgi:hypothetical protein